MKVKSLSHVRLFAIPWTLAHQAPPSMGFSRQEYWSGLLFPSPGDLPDPGIEPRSPALQADDLTSEPPGKPIQNSFSKLLPLFMPQVVLVVKNSPTNTGDIRDVSSIPGLGRSPVGGNGNLFQYSCLENPMDRGAWWATVRGVAESGTAEVT